MPNSSQATKRFVTAAAIIALLVVFLVAYVAPPTIASDVEAAMFFSLAAFVASELAYRLPKGGFGNIAFIPLLSGVAVAPSVPTVIGAGVAILIGEYFLRRDAIRIVFNASQLTIAVGLSVLVYLVLGGTRLTSGGLATLLPFVAAFAVFFLTNAALFSGVVSLSSGQRFTAVLVRAAGGVSLVFDLVGIPIVFGFAYAYVRIGWVWSGALLLPLVGLRQVYKSNRELQTVNEELLQLMVAAIEARDPYTSGHSQRVAVYARIVARAGGLGPRATERVCTAALLHDVGKIHEEFSAILRKPGRLSVDEFAVMKSHSAKGAVLVGKVSQFEDLVTTVLGHHEAWDGSGYPNGLKAEDIPLWARVIAIADTIDAMTTDRPYRAALALDAVRAELVAQGGRQFDPALAKALSVDQQWNEMVTAIVTAREPSASQGGQVVPTHHHSASHARLVNS